MIAWHFGQNHFRFSPSVRVSPIPREIPDCNWRCVWCCIESQMYCLRSFFRLSSFPATTASTNWLTVLLSSTGFSWFTKSSFALQALAFKLRIYWEFTKGKLYAIETGKISGRRRNSPLRTSKVIERPSQPTPFFIWSYCCLFASAHRSAATLNQNKYCVVCELPLNSHLGDAVPMFGFLKQWAMHSVVQAANFLTIASLLTLKQSVVVSGTILSASYADANNASAKSVEFFSDERQLFTVTLTASLNNISRVLFIASDPRAATIEQATNVVGFHLLVSTIARRAMAYILRANMALKFTFLSQVTNQWALNDQGIYLLKVNFTVVGIQLGKIYSHLHTSTDQVSGASDNIQWTRVTNVDELVVILLRRTGVKDTIFLVFTILLVVILTTFLGATLDVKVILKILKKPIAPAIGFFCQYVVLPHVRRLSCVCFAWMHCNGCARIFPV